MRGEQVRHLEAERRDDGLCGAAGVAMKQDTTVVAAADGEARVVVVVGRA